MSADEIRETAAFDHLAHAKERARFAGQWADSPDARTVPSMLEVIAHALIAIAERMPSEDRMAVCPHGMTGLCMYCVRDFDLLGGAR